MSDGELTERLCTRLQMTDAVIASSGHNRKRGMRVRLPRSPYTVLLKVDFGKSAIFQVLRKFLSMYYPQNMFDEAVVFASQGINFSSVPANTTVSYSLFSATGAQNVGNYIQKYGLIPSRSASSGGSSCSA